MQPLNVVLLQGDSSVATSLVSELSNSFYSVQLVKSVGEARTMVAKQRARIAIIDLEAASISDVETLSHDFPQTDILCTHRLADETMWAAALKAGATDFLPSSDTRNIVRAARESAVLMRSAAA